MLRKIQKYIYLPMLLVCISSLGFVCLVLAQEKAATPARPIVDYSSIIAQLKERLPEQTAKVNVPGLAIALVDGDKLVWAEGFGYTDRTNQTKVTADTLFSLQSISKTYAATGFLMAVEKGLLKLDDTLKKYYPQFTVNSRLGADEANRITFRHLLSHRSGLTHEAPCGNNFDTRGCPFADHIRSIWETWLRFPVGERYGYSNLGIDLAGHALELRSGKPFDEFMNDELFRPLGMTSSTFNHKVAAIHPSLAKGHTRDSILPVIPIPMIPAGALYSTVKDMAEYISFHLAGGKIGGKQIIGEALLKEMYTPQFPIDGQVGGYGLGIASEPLHRGTLLQHGGGGYGYLTAQMWTPEYQVGVVVLTNSTSGDPYGIAKYVLQAMIRVKYGPLPQTEPGKPTDRPIITLDIKSLQRLAGTYKPRGSVVTFKVKEDGLYRVSGTPDVKLNPHSPTEFTTGGGKYTFTLDEKGRPKGVQVLTPSYVDFMPFNDSPYEEAGPNKKEWQDFVGEYSCTVCGGTNTDSVMIKNGYLYLRDGGGLKLFEYKPGFFFTADGEAVIFQGDRMLLSNTPYLKKSTKTSLDVPQSTVIQPADKQDARQKPTIGQHDRNLSGKMPTVDQILDKYVQAMGGTEAIRKLKTRVLKGTIEFVKREVTIVGDSEIYAASPNKRMEITRIKVGSCYEEDVLEGFNGTVGWSNSDRFRKLEGAELAVKKREAEFYREIKLKELYPRMILNGTEKIGDRLAYVLNATPAEGDPEKMYFDIETGLLVRIDMEKYFAKYLRVPFQMFLDDYREIDGVKQPFTFRYISPELKIIYRFNEIKHNTVIEDAKINLPGSALTSLPDLTTDERVQLSSLIAPTTDEYIQMEMKRRCIPGLAVVVIKKGEVVKMKGFGLASLDHSVPVTPDTVFDLASVTKQITATAIMTLVDQGKIKLDDPIVQYLPDSPSQWSGITIRHLLTNTAGLRVRYFVNPRYSTANNFKFLSEEPLRSNPGSEYFYSSAGFFLLGMIIEKVSGIRYKDFLAELFFKPLGMNSTSVLGNREIVNNRATCYTIRDGKLANRECYALDDELPASYGVLSTVRDLAKWDIALAAGKLVKEPSLATMWTPVKLNDGSTYPYGFGWEIEKFFGRRMITHSGAAGTEYTFLPDDRLTVIVLTNLGVGEVNSWGLTKGVAIRYLSGLP